MRWQEDGEAEAQHSAASSNVLGSPLLPRPTPRHLCDLEAHEGVSERRDFRTSLEIPTLWNNLLCHDPTVNPVTGRKPT